MNLIIKLINALANFIVTFINGFINLLPDSPIEKINFKFDNTLLSYLNWLIPFNEIIQILTIFVGVYLSYIAIAFILRFFKVIQ